jgi:hypothetical protein
MAATLRLVHKAIGVEVRRGTYDVVLDGERVGSLELNDPIEIPVEPGRHTASPQWPKLQPNQDLRRRRGRNRRLPMQRKEHLADLSPVLRRPQSGTLAPSRVGAAPESERHRTARRGNHPHPAVCNPSTPRRHRVWRRNMPC